MSIADVIAFDVTKQATDIHVQEGCPVMLRIGMELIPCKNWLVTKRGNPILAAGPGLERWRR